MDDILHKTRSLFNTAHAVEADCKELLEFANNSNNPIIQGYYACNLAVSTKYMLNIFKRGPLFNQGKALLEDIISENFDDVELRYIRYTLQSNAPRMLGYHRNIEGDREIIVNYIKNNPNSDLTKHIMVYVNDTKDKIGELIAKK